MEKALVTAGIFLIPTLLLVVAFKLSGRKINWVPLLSAGLASLVYIALLKSRNVIPVPALLEALPLIWFGKILSLSHRHALFSAARRFSGSSSSPFLVFSTESQLKMASWR